jgi:hypothetical protein
MGRCVVAVPARLLARRRTYTGIEAVSNNVQTLREPVVRNGKLTMLYMALSLAFTAGGVILLYLLWQAKPVEGQTLNAVVFGSIIDSLGMSPGINQVALLLVLLFEAGLLFVAANTGFLGGPAVLSNMAADSWLPHQFRHLSTRLVTQNGIVIMGLAALGILLWSGGKVDLLVVLYSINVFLTFSLSLLGLCIYWWRKRKTDSRWSYRFVLSGFGLAVTSASGRDDGGKEAGQGGWVTVVTSVAGDLALSGYPSSLRRGRGAAEGSRRIFSLRAAACEIAARPEAPTAVFWSGPAAAGRTWCVGATPRDAGSRVPQRQGRRCAELWRR